MKSKLTSDIALKVVHTALVSHHIVEELRNCGSGFNVLRYYFQSGTGTGTSCFCFYRETEGIYFSSMRTIYCAIFIMQMVRNFTSTVKPRFTAVFGGKETSAVNRGPR